MRVYLNLKSDHISLKYGSGNGKDDVITEIRTAQELIDFGVTHDYDYMLSSSELDFPQEHTNDPALIALCDFIRNEE
jgi:hypothetical protein